jgi:hypothetical protein
MEDADDALLLQEEKLFLSHQEDPFKIEDVHHG